MSGATLEARLGQLRLAFDNGFASPLAPPRPAGIDLLIVDAGGMSYALRTSELAGLEVDRKVVALPAARRGLLGLCAAHGELVPVFELAALLGAPVSSTSPRWLALHRGQALVALAFDALHAYRRVEPGELGTHQASAADAFMRESIRLDSRFIHVLDIAAMVSSVRQDNVNR